MSNRLVARFLAAILMIIVGLSLSACGLKPAPQESCDFLLNAEEQRVSWGAKTPVVLYVDSSVPNSFYDAIKSAAAEWNRAVGREVLKIGGWSNRRGGPAEDRLNVIYYLNTWEKNRANEQARTTVYWAGDRISEADVRLNGKNFNYFWGEEPIHGRVDIQSLLLHEFGHVLGMSHAETPQSVMARSLPSATLRRGLNSTDQKSIRCEY